MLPTEIRTVSALTITAEIHIAGDRDSAIESLRRQCFEEGLCVSVVDADYVYTGGMEHGVRVRLINYPRFPKTLSEIMARAVRVARELMLDLWQLSATVEGPIETVWLTRREKSK